jgi:hypothetical protein
MSSSAASGLARANASVAALEFTDPRYEPGFDPANLKEVASS